MVDASIKLMIEIKDLAGLSGPLQKLIEVISSGVGNISKPYLIKKNAEARAYELKLITEGIIDSQTKLSEVGLESKSLRLDSSADQGHQIKLEADVSQRAALRVNYQELVGQRNIEAISQCAAEELGNVEEVSEEEVDENWTRRFFKSAEDISNDELQFIWGKILAGEVQKPGTYSLRTLELLRNLSQAEAEIFKKFASLSIISSKDAFIVHPRDEYLKQEFGISFNEILALEEIGLLASHSNLNYSLDISGSKQKSAMVCGDTVILIEIEENTPAVSIPVLVFTKPAQQLLNLIKFTPKLGYLQKIAELLKREGVKLSYARVIKIHQDGTIEHSPSEQIPEETK